MLVRHIRDRVPDTVLAAELQVPSRYVGTVAGQAAAALRYPELADLPSEVRRVLALGGYTTREAVARASDADLLLKRMSAVRLRAVRAAIPRAERKICHRAGVPLSGQLGVARRGSSGRSGAWPARKASRRSTRSSRAV